MIIEDTLTRHGWVYNLRNEWQAETGACFKEKVDAYIHDKLLQQHNRTLAELAAAHKTIELQKQAIDKLNEVLAKGSR